MARRTIVVELTEAQYNALADAVAYADCAWEDTNGRDEMRRRQTLNRAWSAIHTAWHAPNYGRKRLRSPDDLVVVRAAEGDAAALDRLARRMEPVDDDVCRDGAESIRALLRLVRAQYEAAGGAK